MNYEDEGSSFPLEVQVVSWEARKWLGRSLSRESSLDMYAARLLLRKGHVDFPFFNACVCPSSAEVVDSMDPKLAADTNQISLKLFSVHSRFIPHLYVALSLVSL